MKFAIRLLIMFTVLVSLPVQGIVVVATPGQNVMAISDDARLAQLEAQLEVIRQSLRIPGLSAAIVKDQKVVWARGFGLADVENKIPATEHTPYHLASLTKPFAATILLRLVEEGKLSLDDPVSKFGITLETDGIIRVRHLLSHTSEGKPGERYRYNGNRFGELDKVIARITGRAFAELLISNILDPLEMNETAPNVPPPTVTKTPSGTNSLVEEEVRTVITSLFSAYKSGDSEALERLLAPQQNAFRTDGVFLGQLLDANLRNAFRAGLRFDSRITDLDIAVYGDSALATFIVSGTLTPPPGDGPPRPEGPWRTTQFWNKSTGMWKLVHSHQSALGTGIITDKHRQRFASVSRTMAQPYRFDNAFKVTKITHPTYFGTSAGLIASVLDMAKFDIAIDQKRFLKPETQKLAFTPTVSTTGEKLPYGLGWFTQDYRGLKFIWHYGYWTTNSSLILKVPEKNMTFIAMANTDNLSRPTDLGAGDVTSSPVGLAFLKAFIFPELFGEQITEVNWKATSSEIQSQLRQLSGKPYADLYTTELLMHARMHGSVGERAEVARLYKLYAEMHAKPLPDELSKQTPVAQIVAVGNDADKTVEFTLDREQKVRVFATGEGIGGQMYDFGWIENAADGKRMWEMKEGETSHAGGHPKNRKSDATVTLPAGKYRLRYKSDDSHSFDDWNSLPPVFNFWGIALVAL